MAKKSAAGAGGIRKKTVTRNGKTYEYWEARYTAGYDPGTGKQIQRSITGKTQREVSRKLKEATHALDTGEYTEPNKMTLGQWLDIWKDAYLGGVKYGTTATYKSDIEIHIKPALGALRLDALTPHDIQKFYNELYTSGKRVPKHDKDGKTVYEQHPLSGKTIKNIHGVLHKALYQAQRNGYIRFNPADAVTLPRIEKKEAKPLDEAESRAFLDAIKGHRYEALLAVTLFTGMRIGEALGLMWECVDFNRNTIRVERQLQLLKYSGGVYELVPTKNSEISVIKTAPFVMDLLAKHNAAQDEMREKAGRFWKESGLVFTNELGQHLSSSTVSKNYKRLVASIERPDARFHDLRHSYAVAAIRSGDDIKTVQGNLGHATPTFTLNVYAHVTEQMKQESAEHMENYIKNILKQ